MTNPLWILMPIAGAADLTPAAIADCLDQSVPTRLLLLCQGIDRGFRVLLERIAEADPERIFCCFFDPPLPSLSAVWNHGLRFVWGQGGTEALVVNNDVRLHRDTCFTLSNAREYHEAWFVSAVGVTEAQFDTTLDFGSLEPEHGSKGGPDFSCFLISKYGHERYPFDEAFIPAYCEDLDTHRRYMLGGDGSRIFSINLPYLHYASGTLKSLSPAARAKKEAAIEGSRAYYAKKWGGPVNEETFAEPFNPASAVAEYATTPFLQRLEQEKAREHPQSDRPGDSAGAGVLGGAPDCDRVLAAAADRRGTGCDPGDPGGGGAARVDRADPGAVVSAALDRLSRLVGEAEGWDSDAPEIPPVDQRPPL